MKKTILILLIAILAFAGIVFAEVDSFRTAKRDAAFKQYGKSVPAKAAVSDRYASEADQNLAEKFSQLRFPENISSALANEVSEGKYSTEKIQTGTHVDAAIKNGVLGAGSTLKWSDPEIKVRVKKYAVGGYVVHHVIGQDIWFRISIPSQEVVKTEVKPAKKGDTNSDSVAKMAKAVQMVKADSVSDKQKKWGSFPESSVWTGAWMKPGKDEGGVWFNWKYLQWFTKYERAENFAIGANLRGDYGKILKNGDADWGYLAPGIMAGYYRGLGLRNSFQTDASLLWRFDKNRQDGFMPALHAELSRVIDYQNRVYIQVDGNYFPGDSWLGPSLNWEHKLNKDWKTIVSAGASLSWLDGDFFSAFMPGIRVKYKNRWNVGFNANILSTMNPLFGIIFAYELTPDINTWYEKQKADSVKVKQEGTNNSDLQQIEISEQTIDEMEKEGGR